MDYYVIFVNTKLIKMSQKIIIQVVKELNNQSYIESVSSFPSLFEFKSLGYEYGVTFLNHIIWDSENDLFLFKEQFKRHLLKQSKIVFRDLKLQMKELDRVNIN